MITALQQPSAAAAEGCLSCSWHGQHNTGACEVCGSRLNEERLLSIMDIYKHTNSMLTPLSPFQAAQQCNVRRTDGRHMEAAMCNKERVRGVLQDCCMLSAIATAHLPAAATRYRPLVHKHGQARSLGSACHTQHMTACTGQQAPNHQHRRNTRIAAHMSTTSYCLLSPAKLWSICGA